MKIKYNKKKEELRKDPVLESIEKAQKFLTEQGTKVFIGLLIAAVLFIGFKSITYFQNRQLVKAQEAFGKATIHYQAKNQEQAREAFDQVLENFANTPLAAYSAYMLGHMYLTDKKYDQAIAYYERALASKKSKGFTRGETLEALATCYEGKDDLAKALEFLVDACKDKNITYRYPALYWKIALINKKLGKREEVLYYCNKIVNDTLALNFQKKAKNLIATM